MWCLWIAIMMVMVPLMIAEEAVRPHRRGYDE